MKFLPENKDAQKYLGKGVAYLYLCVFLVIIVLVLLAIGAFVKTYNLGDLGSILSGTIGVLSTLLVAIFTFLAFYSQYDANLKIQKQFQIQQFESQYYKMVDLYINNVNGFSIKNYQLHGYSEEIEISSLTGKKIFIAMVTEYHALVEIIYNFYKKAKDKENKDLNRLAFKIFFFGIKSEHVKPINSKDKVLKKLLKKLEFFQNGFRNSESKNRIFEYGKFKLKVKIRYTPFSGHESRLAHYYRHLYQTVKQVVDAENREIISYNEARRYLATLRAQLSNEEQQLLYYNYLYFAGNKWDLLGQTHEFFTRYRMIHNIPLDDNRIPKNIEHPRVHFKDFICKLKDSDEDDLFEWGDNRKEICKN